MFSGLAGDEEFFDEDFNKDFADLEAGNKFYSKIEDGFRNWEERYELYFYRVPTFYRYR